MAEASHAVFLSYASQDAEAAHKICDALRAGGIEVFLDQSELRGGDAWDKKIRHEIHDCVLFIPIVSQHTQERLEGYFRHEWNLAIERTHHMAENKAFLVPVVVDGTPEHDPSIPEKFRELQWTRLPAGETPPEFVTRIHKLLSGESGPVPTTARSSAAVISRRSSRVMPAVLAVVLAAIAAYLIVEKPWMAKSVAFAPPAHSIAVLPFVNMSADKEQEYFSDGLTEEILNSLARINELQVSARTSSFSFKGQNTDIGTIARKLNVGAVLEGSVRREGNTIRITAQLNNAATGFHLWSQTYDRDLSNVLQLQTDIANAVASALKVTLLGDTAAKIEVGGTRVAAAFDSYLRASHVYLGYQNEKDLQAALVAYDEAIRLDPNYALAYADRSVVLSTFARNFTNGPAIRKYLDSAQADAQKAIALAPDLAEGHIALGEVFRWSLEYTLANQEFEPALALAPGNARVLGEYGRWATNMGHSEAGLTALRRAVVLDPLGPRTREWLGEALWTAGRYDEALVALTEAKALAPNNRYVNAYLGYAYYSTGNFQSALAACESADENNKLICLALVYEKLGRHADAEAALAKMRTEWGEDCGTACAAVYAAWGDRARALDWLETAMRRHDPYLELTTIKIFDPLRKEPRFQAVMRELRFPE